VRGNCLAGHHEVGGRAARGGRRGQKKATGVSWRGGEDTSAKRGPVVRETRERRPAQEGVNRKGKRIFREDATGRWAGWARGRTGHGVGRAKNQKKRNF
jgi:hypothetical protein